MTGHKSSSEEACALNDCIGRCKGSVNAWVNAVPLVWKYPLYSGLARVLNAITGVGFTEQELSMAGRRVYLLEIAINALRGVRRTASRLVQRPELRDTPAGRQQRGQFEDMLTEYCQRRGCHTDSGIPTRAALEAVGLPTVADALENGPARLWAGPPLWPLDDYPAGGHRA